MVRKGIRTRASTTPLTHLRGNPAARSTSRRFLIAEGSSGKSDCLRRCQRVGGSVAEHGPKDVEPAPGKGEHGLNMGFSFNAFSVVVGP